MERTPIAKQSALYLWQFKKWYPPKNTIGFRIMAPRKKATLMAYIKGELDEIYIVYTKMVSPIKEEAEMMQLLPLKKADFQVQIPADIPMEQLSFRPSPEKVMNQIIPGYIEGFVYGALVESYSCEQNARMMAMESATKSAKDMLHELDILYNRARQAAITQEITEVIAGAKAQKNKK